MQEELNQIENSFKSCKYLLFFNNNTKKMCKEENQMTQIQQIKKSKKSSCIEEFTHLQKEQKISLKVVNTSYQIFFNISKKKRCERKLLDDASTINSKKQKVKLH